MGSCTRARARRRLSGVRAAHSYGTGEALAAAAGIDVELCRVFAGDAVPTDLGDHVALVVRGGPMPATGDAGVPSRRAEIARLADALARDHAVLGVCLGAPSMRQAQCVEPMPREAQPADAAELVRLRIAMYDSMGVDSGGAWQEACLAHIAAHLDAGDLVGSVVDAPDGAGLASCALAELTAKLPGPGMLHGHHAHVLSVCTDPRWRRRGLARTVMRHLLDRLDRSGIERAELHATPTGEPLYRSLGFVDRPGPRELRRVPPG